MFTSCSSLQMRPLQLRRLQLRHRRAHGRPRPLSRPPLRAPVLPPPHWPLLRRPTLHRLRLRKVEDELFDPLLGVITRIKLHPRGQLCCSWCGHRVNRDPFPSLHPSAPVPPLQESHSRTPAPR
ncbi:hypothetical protein MUK42_18693 [Musa troglodytarum]|uniref:Uncharacterized protein n=1 Tax=Musa troglodytarum TaxID=320322 RepID=A0A9E7JFG1_9LILI|nr:hypothetical protein MUK42_18693 [Musa troglodytarum]